LLALRLCSSTIFSCQPLFLLNAVSPAAPLIGIATRLTYRAHHRRPVRLNDWMTCYQKDPCRATISDTDEPLSMS
jgi:hypothetical protein